MSKVYDTYGLYKQVAPQILGRGPEVKVLTQSSRKNDQNCKIRPSSEPIHETRRAMCIWHNIGVLSCNHNCRGKAMCVCSVSYPPCKAHVPHYIVIYGLSRSTTFFEVISSTAQFLRKKWLNIKYVFRFHLQLLSETFFILKESEILSHMYTGIHMM